ncbi:hypothetical protein I553_3878 [Mycobacterium xenopi 4042]|uniref:Uncharacterized protein n=1 Tax=Mycobacterium xenopi 4042 TaxID=1299334 RepID=X8ED44_MYCXE|nr:hypothetical protein I553_3878 [Mycobacterium xenopi 4042]
MLVIAAATTPTCRRGRGAHRRPRRRRGRRQPASGRQLPPFEARTVALLNRGCPASPSTPTAPCTPR